MTATDPVITTGDTTQFGRYFASYTASLFSAALATGVVAWIAVERAALSATAFGLLLAAASGVAATLAVVVGSRIDRWSKRTALVGIDLCAGIAACSLAVAMWAGQLSVVHLWLVATTQLTAAIIMASASAPLLKVLAWDRLDWANGRQEAVFWSAQLVGPPTGGAVTSVAGPEWTLIGNAVGFGLAALLITRVQVDGGRNRSSVVRERADPLAGLRVIWSIRPVRLLYLNALVFGVGVMASSPVLALLVLRELGLPAWQYGVVLGLPCLGGSVAGLMAQRVLGRLSRLNVLRVAGVARALWLVPLAAVPSGPSAVVWLLAFQTALLFSAGLFNPVFATTRIMVTPDHRLGAVVASWGASTRLLHPVGLLAGGALADLLGTRPALAIAGMVCIVSAVPLLSIQVIELDDCRVAAAVPRPRRVSGVMGQWCRSAPRGRRG